MSTSYGIKERFYKRMAEWKEFVKNGWEWTSDTEEGPKLNHVIVTSGFDICLDEGERLVNSGSAIEPLSNRAPNVTETIWQSVVMSSQKNHIYRVTVITRLEKVQ